ncbi:hypothetical protein BA894_24655 [Vibrio natriegens]|jgi:hypothetical protein|nr:hypothetical protein BA894_24655 [Vibrio natriegens]
MKVTAYILKFFLPNATLPAQTYANLALVVQKGRVLLQRSSNHRAWNNQQHNKSILLNSTTVNAKRLASPLKQN